MNRKTSVVRLLSLAVLLLFAPGAARADTPKYKRTGPKLNVKVRQTERTRGLQDAGSKKAAAPEITADEFLAIQGKVKNIRKEQIKEYEALIQDTDEDDAELPLLLFQLAEIYAQQQRYWRFRAMEMFEKIEKAKKGKAQDELKAKQKSYFAEEEKFLKNSIATYAKIANNEKFKNFPKMDEVLFYYAFTLKNAKRLDLSRKVFHKLLTEYPKSKYVPEAYLAFADFFFEENDLVNAEKFYKKVLEFPSSKVYAYAMYKKGWVHLNQKSFQDALETFSEVARITDKDKNQGTLNKAAKKDIVRAYAEVGRAEKAYKFFQRVDKDYSFNMLKILGSVYLDQGKAEKTIFTHRELISLRPKDPEVCEWQYNIVQAQLTMGDKGKQADEVERLVKLYSKYKELGVLKGQALDECSENASATTSELAKLWHQESMKTLNLDTLAFSERLYKSYIDNFPQAEDIGEMEYYYADLLWVRAENEEEGRMATERWERAAAAFTDVVKRGKLTPEQKKDAAYAAVLGWKNALAVDPRSNVKIEEDPNDAEGEKLPPPKKIDEREQKMLDAFDIYLTYVKDPNDEERVVMKFLKARTYWRHYHYDQAVPLFEDIVANHQNHPASHDAAVILINIYIRMGKYQQVDKLVTQLLANEKFLEDKEELKNDLLGLKAQSGRINAKQLEKDGKNLECGQAYLDIYNRAPNASKMDEVLYNAGVCFEQAKSIGLSIQAFQKLAERYPDSKLTQRALYRTGLAYGAIAYYKEAAEKFEEFAKKFGGEEMAPDALSNAVMFRKGIGDDAQAIKDTEFFVAQYRKKQKDKAAEASFNLVAIYEKQNDTDKAKKHLEKYLKEFGATGGKDRVIIAHAKIGEILWNQSCKVKAVDGSCITVQRERGARKRSRRKGSDLPSQCGPESKIKLKVVERDSKLVKEAMSHFKQAAQEYAKFKPLKGEDGGDARNSWATYYFTAAKFYMVEEGYEEFLSMEFPTKLDFDPRNPKKAEASKKRFLEWFENKRKNMVRTVKSYEEVRDIKGGGQTWRIAGAARIGQASQNFADGLYTAEVPREVRTGQFAEDGWNAYCDALNEQAEPLEKLSVDAFKFCLDKSTELSWFNQWSKLCERELGQLQPGTYPTAAEIHIGASAVAPITDTQALASEIK